MKLIELTDEDRSELGKIGSVLVTGASGVIGSELLSLFCRLRETGIFRGRIVAVSRTRAPSESLDRVRDLVILGDLTDPSVQRDLPSSDYVFHGATSSEPSVFMANPVETIRLNVEVTLLLKSLCRSSFTFLSTSEIYSGLSHKASESDVGSTNPQHPRAPYIDSKRLGEVATHLPSKSIENLRCNVARVSLAYGVNARFDDSRILYELVRRAAEDNSVWLSGSGSGVRSYAYAPDIAELLLAMSLRWSGETVNLGTEDLLSLDEVAQIVATLSEVQLVKKPGQRTPPGAPSLVSIDTSKSRKLMVEGAEFTTLEQGLTMLIKKFRRNLEEMQQS